jgi:hypothetical protein
MVLRYRQDTRLLFYYISEKIDALNRLQLYRFSDSAETLGGKTFNLRS